MKTHYRFVQVVNVVIRGQAILDKIWTKMEEVYTPPVTISELGSSDHDMVLLKPKAKNSVDTGCVTRLTVRCMGPKEKATFTLKYNFYQTQIAAMHESGSHDWWKHMKTIMGLKTNGKSCMQGLANKTTDGDCGLLANIMNDFFVSVSDHLPRLNKSHKVFDVNEELPDQYVISVCTTFKALESGKANKATGPDNIPAWVLRNYANVFAPPLTAIF